MKEGINEFYDLEAWKQAHIFVIKIYKLSGNFSKEETYSVKMQIRRAVSSVAANIAEGFGRYHFKEKQKFYYNARGSLVEVQNFLLLCKDLKYIKGSSVNNLLFESKRVGQLINGLIRSIERNR